MFWICICIARNSDWWELCYGRETAEIRPEGWTESQPNLPFRIKGLFQKTLEDTGLLAQGPQLSASSRDFLYWRKLCYLVIPPPSNIQWPFNSGVYNAGPSPQQETALRSLPPLGLPKTRSWTSPLSDSAFSSLPPFRRCWSPQHSPTKALDNKLPLKVCFTSLGAKVSWGKKLKSGQRSVHSRTYLEFSLQV